MEYGYDITDTVGNKTFFVEGCTYCSMSTGGLHEQQCPLSKPLVRTRTETYAEFGARLYGWVEEHPERGAKLL